MTVTGLARTNWMTWRLNRIWIRTPPRITIHRFRMMLMQMLGLRRRDPDSAGDGHVERDNSGSIPAFTPRIWESIPCNYTPNVEFDYRYTSGLNSSINLNAEQQLSGCRGLRHVSGCRRLPGVAASW